MTIENTIIQSIAVVVTFLLNATMPFMKKNSRFYNAFVQFHFFFPFSELSGSINMSNEEERETCLTGHGKLVFNKWLLVMLIELNAMFNKDSKKSAVAEDLEMGFPGSILSNGGHYGVHLVKAHS